MHLNLTERRPMYGSSTGHPHTAAQLQHLVAISHGALKIARK
jgi:hypothetical protein